MRIHIDSIYYAKREEDEMKKILAIMLVLILTLCGCSNGNTKYVEELSAINESGISYYTPEELYADYAVKDEENTEYLNYVKENLRQFERVDEYSSLNWGAFDKVESIYWLDSQKDIPLPEGVDLDALDAVYLKKLSGIMLFPKLFTYSSDQQFHVVTHELCHALLDSGNYQKQNNFIIEGETELLALSFSISLGIAPEGAYPYGVFTAAWLNDLFGGKQVRGAIIENELEKMIDEVLGAGSCAKINLGGILAERDVKPKLGKNAIIELLCHLSKRLEKAGVGEKWLEKIAGTSDDVDVRYFKKILSS